MNEQLVLKDIINQIEKEKEVKEMIDKLYPYTDNVSKQLENNSIALQARIMSRICTYADRSYYQDMITEYYRHVNNWKNIFGDNMFIEIPDIMVKPDINGTDLGYLIIRALNQAMHDGNIPQIHAICLNENRITNSKGQNTKLSKYLAKVDKQLADQYSTALTNAGSLYTLRLSALPLDIFTASEYASFHSCYRFDGEYSAGPWDLLANNHNRVLIAFAYRSKIELGGAGYLHPKKYWRCWVFFSKKWNTIFIMRQYAKQEPDLMKALQTLLANVFGNGVNDFIIEENISTIDAGIRMSLSFGGYPDPVHCVMVRNGKKPAHIYIRGGHICPSCGDRTDGDNGIICNGCDGEHIRCEGCGNSVYEDEIYTSPDGYGYCHDCFFEIYSFCQGCGDTVHDDDARIGADEEPYCDYCYNRRFTDCYNCGESIYNRDVQEINGNNYCEDCMHDIAFMCDTCNDLFLNEDIIETDDGIYCQDCYEEIEEEEKTL